MFVNSTRQDDFGLETAYQRTRRRLLRSSVGASVYVCTASLGFSQTKNEQAQQSYLAWVFGSQLSLALIRPPASTVEDPARDPWFLAENMAKFFEVSIPSFPERTSDLQHDVMNFVDYVSGPGDRIKQQIAEQSGSVTAGVFELAMRTNILPAVYKPSDDAGIIVSDFLRKRASFLNLPECLWRPLVNSVEAGLPHQTVTARMFEMNTQIQNYLYEQ